MFGVNNKLIFKITRFLVVKICVSMVWTNKTECWCYVIFISGTYSKTRVISLQTI